jgi:hypothetical protein
MEIIEFNYANPQNAWHEEVKARDFIFDPQNKWFVMGYYKDEMEAFRIAEKVWEDKRDECYEKYVGGNVGTLEEFYNGVGDLDIVDDYFHWRVETPPWYLHTDGTWRKLLINEDSNKKIVYSGRFPSKEEAEKMLQEVRVHPSRFENYIEHLRSAGEPYSPFLQATT